jgi:hypothetical protein
VWDKALETGFRKSKERNIELIVEGVASFDMDLVTCLSPDYSKHGLDPAAENLLLSRYCAYMLCI